MEGSYSMYVRHEKYIKHFCRKACREETILWNLWNLLTRFIRNFLTR
jgi:hypothetical protein